MPALRLIVVLGLALLLSPVPGLAQSDASAAAATPPAATAPPQSAPAQTIRDHPPGRGFTIAETDWISVNFSAYASIRYLNQQGLEDSYTNGQGVTLPVDRRNDMQFQKALLYFKGWLGTPRLRYVTYVWTSNTSQGLGAQVVVAGNLTYELNRHFVLGAGIGGLPTTRSVRGQFPFWLKHDNRTVADEFFRGSYTTGIWSSGQIVTGLYYRAMLGNNLSQLGVDAGQLDDGFDTFSTAVWWQSGDLPMVPPFGDFEQHEEPAFMLGAAFTRSNETRQSQAGTEDPENSQIRVADGSPIFDNGSLVPGVQLLEATYRMAAFDGGFKYRGFSLDGEFYTRWITDLVANGPLPVDELRHHGYELQASAMLVERVLQAYVFHSRVFGEDRDPWDAGTGINWFPFETKILRSNTEVIWVERSPVGNLGSPLLVGADGLVFYTNLELFF